MLSDLVKDLLNKELDRLNKDADYKKETIRKCECSIFNNQQDLENLNHEISVIEETLRLGDKP